MATVVLLWQRPGFKEWVFQKSIEGQIHAPVEPPAQPILPYAGPEPAADRVQSAADLFRADTVWTAHLAFDAETWSGLGPRRVAPLRGWLRPDGAPNLRNPAASRAGVAGIFGFDFPWSRADFELGGVLLTNVGARFKGNGTFLDSLKSYRRPFKLDLDRHVPDRRFAGQASLNLHNLAADRSFLSDTLGYEFFRAAGVPAPRTTFLRLFLTLEPRWERRLLGAYLLVENPDAHWAREAFAADGAVLFKPSTLELFHDLGTDWAEYETVYDPKTDVPDKARNQLVELCRLVTHGEPEAFAARIGNLVDIDAFARHLACEALLSNYDGILSNGQNFLLWWDPRTERFGLSPWDLDHSWGEFGWIGTARQREDASLMHPWVGENRFLERMLAVESVAEAYRRELRRLLDTVFLPDRLHRRIDELAAILRPVIAEFSTDRLERFERAVGEPPPDRTADATADVSAASDAADAEPSDRHRVHNLKRFITARAASARDQLEGRRTGWIPTRNRAF